MVHSQKKKGPKAVTLHFQNMYNLVLLPPVSQTRLNGVVHFLKKLNVIQDVHVFLSSVEKK